MKFKIKFKDEKVDVKKFLKRTILSLFLGLSVGIALQYEKIDEFSKIKAFKDGEMIDNFTKNAKLEKILGYDIETEESDIYYYIKSSDKNNLSYNTLNKYVEDEILYGKREYMASPDEYIKNGMRGDCEDYANFVATILKKKGYEPIIAFGDCGISGHAWTEVKINGSCYVADVSLPSILLPKKEWKREFKTCVGIYEIDSDKSVKLYSGCKE